MATFQILQAHLLIQIGSSLVVVADATSISLPIPHIISFFFPFTQITFKYFIEVNNIIGTTQEHVNYLHYPRTVGCSHMKTLNQIKGLELEVPLSKL